MKKVSVILSHLTAQPQFKVLKQQECYGKYLSLLTPKYQKAIAFIYVKEQTLFIAVKHPGFKMELNYNRDLLKSLLTQLISYNKECEMMQSNKVVIFHSKYHPMVKESQIVSTVPYYNELATQDFKIQTEDEALLKKFNNIKEAIACNK